MTSMIGVLNLHSSLEKSYRYIHSIDTSSLFATILTENSVNCFGCNIKPYFFSEDESCIPDWTDRLSGGVSLLLFALVFYSSFLMMSIVGESWSMYYTCVWYKGLISFGMVLIKLILVYSFICSSILIVGSPSKNWMLRGWFEMHQQHCLYW